MFYSGIYLNNQNDTASIVVLEKSLKSARKLYRICHICEVTHYTTGGLLLNKLTSLSVDRTFIRKKKIFSQSNRPPKTTWTPPVFVAASQANSENETSKIRDKKFSIEGVLYEENDRWHKKELATLRYGCNYYVNPEEIKKILIKACKNERLLFEANGGLTNKLEEDLQGFMKETAITSDLISAVSIAVWFCERIKKIKRY